MKGVADSKLTLHHWRIAERSLLPPPAPPLAWAFICRTR
jgi:hypothetical protein